MRLTGFLPIYRRELRSYLTSPAVYVAAALFLFLSGIFFYGILDSFSQLSGNAEYRKEMGFDKINFTRHVVSNLFWSINFLMLFVVPAFTMRLLAEEKKTGTFELLASLPFTDWNIVVAKFLAAYTVIAAILAVCGYYVIVMVRFGTPEMPVVCVAFLGAFLCAAAYVAVGLFASSLTENQIVAAIVSFVALLGLFLVGDITAPGASSFSRVLEMLSMRYHGEQFTRGQLRLEDAAYFLMIVAVSLFLTCRNLEIRRWRV
jgi:ABC-2 type transport system permease protein